MAGALRRGGSVLLWFLATLTPGWAAAVNPVALLVGVSEYPTLPAALQLAGPRNDVLQMHALLVERGVPEAAIRTLADGVPGAALPTRANILAELDRLGTTARAGDHVVIYFAGHGSQQPVDPASPAAAAEPDGLFETFLPRDVGAWQALPGRPTGAVQNAIADHEIRARVDRISRNGAFVWAIFDACHAATLVRGAADDADDANADPELRLRRVRPDQLGVPRAAMVAAAQLGRSADRRPDGEAPLPVAAGAVYFYASQTTESTPELRLPPHSPQGVRHGLFTYALAQSLAGGAGMSYRQLAQAILVRYASMEDGAGVTPLFSGNALDSPVLGLATPAVRQWRLQSEGGGLALAAGQLSDLYPGALLAVMPTPAAPLAQALGYVHVQASTANSSQLVAEAHAGLKAPGAAALKAGTVARLVTPAARLGLVVGSDLGGCAVPCGFDAAIARLRAVPVAGIEWATEGAPDLRLVAVGNRLWLLPRSVAGRPCSDGSAAQRSACADTLARHAPSLLAAPGVATDAIVAALGNALQSAARVSALLRTAGPLATLPARPFDAEVVFAGRGGAKQPFREGTVPLLASDDHVLVRWHNGSLSPVDVTALYIDARYGIQALYPPPGAINRLAPDDTAAFDLRLDASETDGLERLLLIAVPAQPQQERADFSVWAQATLPGQQPVRGATVDGTVMRVVSWRLGH